jgi:aromatic ring-opening dioxygenase catalytic subunit (LigB family)
MSVHNLRDLPVTPATKQPTAYSVSFDEALQAAVESKPQGRKERMAALVERSDARLAHPTFEHFWPIIVACGAGAEEKGKRIWGMGEGGLGWAMFKWGEVSA